MREIPKEAEKEKDTKRVIEDRYCCARDGTLRRNTRRAGPLDVVSFVPPSFQSTWTNDGQEMPPDGIDEPVFLEREHSTVATNESPRGGHAQYCKAQRARCLWSVLYSVRVTAGWRRQKDGINGRDEYTAKLIFEATRFHAQYP